MYIYKVTILYCLCTLCTLCTYFVHTLYREHNNHKTSPSLTGPYQALPSLPGHKSQNVKMSAILRYQVKIPCIAALSPSGLVLAAIILKECEIGNM